MKANLVTFAATLLIGLAALLGPAASQTTRPATQPAASQLFNRMPDPPRSPIPLPGERITRPIELALRKPAAQADAPTTRPASGTAQGDVIPWSEAPRHMGKTVTVEGVIVDTHNTGEVCFLNFQRDRRSFYLILWKESFDDFPEPPERYFLNKRVRCTGEVSENRGRPQIRIKDSKQISVVE